MKRRLQVAAIGVWAALLVYQGNAQTNTTTTPTNTLTTSTNTINTSTNTTGTSTNVALVVTIALTGLKDNGQSNAIPVRITTKDVLALLNPNGGVQFDKTARLIFLSDDDQEPTIWVQQGSKTNFTLVDASSVFTISQPLEVDSNNNLTSYAIRIFSFDNGNGTTFSVSGFTTMRRTRITSRNVGTLLRVSTAQAQVAGGGTINSASTVLRGTINASSPQVLVMQD